MEIMLADNIRSFRKQQRMTQEQFAEVLGVTTGAVYKWESGLSVPELNLIIEMADFFDISVDALLGYKMKDNSFDSSTNRLKDLLRERDPEVLTEAEKLLKKYPHSFEIVLSCAEAYMAFGGENHVNEYLLRSINLLEQSLLLISQNTDPTISEFTIYGQIGSAYFMMGEEEKGLDILRNHNSGGMFNCSIGAAMSVYLNRIDVAEPYLSAGLIGSVSDLISVVIGYAFVYKARNEYQLELDIISWCLDLLHGLNSADTPNYIDKTQALLFIVLAHAQLNTGAVTEACTSLKKAYEYVTRFDSAPDYGSLPIRFATSTDNVLIFDTFGITAEESTEWIINMLDDPSLFEMWKEVCNNE